MGCTIGSESAKDAAFHQPVSSHRGLRTAEAAAVIVDLGSSNRISLDKLKGIAKRVAVNWAAPWLCPEVAPPAA
jgi:hypothetical protein